ncbi:hypothetical protein [Anaerosolibacter sp.]|uniref:hypothetical protein n=1 Tax=Anaerosolibacter sp. TaxID=1872527 RepID=UPI0039EF4ED9
MIKRNITIGLTIIFFILAAGVSIKTYNEAHEPVIMQKLRQDILGEPTCGFVGGGTVIGSHVEEWGKRQQEERYRYGKRVIHEVQWKRKGLIIDESQIDGVTLMNDKTRQRKRIKAIVKFARFYLVEGYDELLGKDG